MHRKRNSITTMVRREIEPPPASTTATMLRIRGLLGKVNMGSYKDMVAIMKCMIKVRVALEEIVGLMGFLLIPHLSRVISRKLHKWLIRNSNKGRRGKLVGLMLMARILLTFKSSSLVSWRMKN